MWQSTKMQDSTKTKRHTCPHESCKAAFDRPYRLRQHLLVHENIKIFQCLQEGCSKAYTSKSHLDRHVNTAHESNEDVIIYSCPKCFKRFANEQNIKRHLRKAHPKKLAIFSCNECRAKFMKKHKLKTHIYTHTGIKGFSCTKCSDTFVTLKEKKRHLKFHKTYVCEDCFSVFNHWSAFQKHKKAEHADKEFICDHCERKFKQRQHILHHMKLHSNTRVIKKFIDCPYEDCNRQYTRKANLKQHIKMRHEKITHNCTICEAKLSTKAKLSNHLKLHERKEPIVRTTKTKAMGRKERKDKNTVKSTVLFKIADLMPTEDMLIKLKAA